MNFLRSFPCTPLLRPKLAPAGEGECAESGTVLAWAGWFSLLDIFWGHFRKIGLGFVAGAIVVEPRGTHTKKIMTRFRRRGEVMLHSLRGSAEGDFATTDVEICCDDNRTTSLKRKRL